MTRPNFVALLSLLALCCAVPGALGFARGRSNRDDLDIGRKRVKCGDEIIEEGDWDGDMKGGKVNMTRFADWSVRSLQWLPAFTAATVRAPGSGAAGPQW